MYPKVASIGNIEDIFDEVLKNCISLYGMEWTIGTDTDNQSTLYVREDKILPAGMYFATGNRGKLKTAQERFPFELKQIDLDIEESQDTVKEIASHKARVAYAVTGRSVIADDSGFVIPEAGGYPDHLVARELNGDYPGFIEKVRERLPGKVFPDDGVYSYWVQVLSYMDEKITEPKLISNKADGTLIEEQRGDITLESCPWVKSLIGSGFIPTKFSRTLAEMDREEYFSVTASRGPDSDRYRRLLEYLDDHKV